MKKLTFIFLIFILIVSCKKEEDLKDYKNPFTGSFSFTTIQYATVMCSDTIQSLCIDFTAKINIDTTYFTGYVQERDSNKLKIQFGDVIISGLTLDTLNQPVFPTISSNGDLSLPDFFDGVNSSFKGSYIGYDTLNMIFSTRYGMGGYDTWEITGIRD